VADFVSQVRSICGSHIPVILVGCKRDLRDAAEASGSSESRPMVSRAKGEQVAASIGARVYKECSSLKNEGKCRLFLFISPWLFH
jgi:Rho family protein